MKKRALASYVNVTTLKGERFVDGCVDPQRQNSTLVDRKRFIETWHGKEMRKDAAPR